MLDQKKPEIEPQNQHNVVLGIKHFERDDKDASTQFDMLGKSRSYFWLFGENFNFFLNSKLGFYGCDVIIFSKELGIFY